MVLDRQYLYKIRALFSSAKMNNNKIDTLDKKQLKCGGPIARSASHPVRSQVLECVRSEWQKQTAEQPTVM